MDLPAHIPPLGRSNSWVVTRKGDGGMVGEFFDASVVARLDPAKCLIETAHDYLCRVNPRMGKAVR